MKEILFGSKLIKGICGSQKYKDDQDYLLSRYCLKCECEDGILLYHLITGEMILLSNGETVEKNRNALILHWFLVPEGFDERKYVDDIRKIIGMSRPREQTKADFTILTTTDCNARCFYCYEIGIKRIPMSADIAGKTAEYIIHMCGGKKVKLRWFGGEPLYNKQAINIICEKLRDSGIAYESSMISNGYYLDQKTAAQAVREWHLKKVQITIDGTEKIYNRTKAYINDDENPFLRVMNNIQNALNAGINVTLRLNMDAQNAGDLLELTDDIAQRFAKNPQLNTYVALLQAFSGKIHEHQTQQQMEKDLFMIRNKLSENGMLRREKLPVGMRLIKCMADNDNSEVILPDGRVGRCEHFSEKMVTGSIWDDIRDKAVEQKWKIPLLVPECEECRLYPLCSKLKMCEWNQNGCLETDRKIQMIELKEQMLAAYYEKKNGGMKSETER